ncbi:O-antigen ligase family protein [Metarhizobium album]|nr:O-antigen ligase family protein [Rhizobium album]
MGVSLWNPGANSLLGGLGEPLRYALFGGLSLAIIVYTYITRGIRVSLSAEWTLLLAFLAYTIASAAWSEGGASAMMKATLISLTVMVSICIVNLKWLDEILVIHYRLVGCFVTACFVTVLLFPDIGIETGWELEGDWKGLAGQKNELGALAAYVVVSSVAIPLPKSRIAVAIRVVVFAIAGTCLVFSGSRGGQLIAVIGIAALIASRLPKTAQRVSLLLLLACMIPLLHLVASTISLTDDRIGVLGATFNTSNRTTLWFYGLEQLRDRLFLGFGVGGFWTTPRLLAFQDTHGWVLDNFHNGYVTILIEGGLVGLLLLMGALAFIMLLLLMAIGHLRDAHLSLGFAFVVMTLVSNVVENLIGRSTSLSFMTLLIVCFSIHAYVSWLAGRQTDQDFSYPRGYRNDLLARLFGLQKVNKA